MGTKYVIRTNEVREFPLQNLNYTDYCIQSFFEFIKLLITKRKRLIYATVNFF